MRTDHVVPKQPIDHLQIEGMYIVSQERSVEHNEVFRDGPIEPFDEGVLLRRTHMGIEVRETQSSTSRFEVLGKLGAVVCLEFVNLKRTDLDDLAEEVGCRSR